MTDLASNAAAKRTPTLRDQINKGETEITDLSRRRRQILAQSARGFESRSQTLEIDAIESQIRLLRPKIKKMHTQLEDIKK